MIRDLASFVLLAADKSGCIAGRGAPALSIPVHGHRSGRSKRVNMHNGVRFDMPEHMLRSPDVEPAMVWAVGSEIRHVETIGQNTLQKPDFTGSSNLLHEDCISVGRLVEGTRVRCISRKYHTPTIRWKGGSIFRSLAKGLEVPPLMRTCGYPKFAGDKCVSELMVEATVVCLWFHLFEFFRVALRLRRPSLSTGLQGCHDWNGPEALASMQYRQSECTLGSNRARCDGMMRVGDVFILGAVAELPFASDRLRRQIARQSIMQLPDSNVMIRSIEVRGHYAEQTFRRIPLE
ncbi:hypothetical protein NUW58_g632 [Xylaria curta]|uniref:Uncharacterized protein n=1 Tax=Xylaria curta TaxID=42375 RepID=A0ACC1PP14_9PEZI|nr:hypothetical protein NUW58_g632 [Xylaria curta]